MKGSAYVQRGGGAEHNPGRVNQKEIRFAKIGGLNGPIDIRWITFGDPAQDVRRGNRNKSSVYHYERVLEVSSVASTEVKLTEAVKQVGAASRPGATSDGTVTGTDYASVQRGTQRPIGGDVRHNNGIADSWICYQQGTQARQRDQQEN